jgi:hypothetical protein
MYSIENGAEPRGPGFHNGLKRHGGIRTQKYR